MPRCCKYTYDNGQCTTCGTQTERGITMEENLRGPVRDWYREACEVQAELVAQGWTVDEHGYWSCARHLNYRWWEAAVLAMNPEKEREKCN